MAVAHPAGQCPGPEGGCRRAHGSRSHYSTGCRCADCTMSNRERSRLVRAEAARHVQPGRLVAPPGSRPPTTSRPVVTAPAPGPSTSSLGAAGIDSTMFTARPGPGVSPASAAAWRRMRPVDNPAQQPRTTPFCEVCLTAVARQRQARGSCKPAAVRVEQPDQRAWDVCRSHFEWAASRYPDVKVIGRYGPQPRLAFSPACRTCGSARGRDPRVCSCGRPDFRPTATRDLTPERARRPLTAPPVEPRSPQVQPVSAEPDKTPVWQILTKAITAAARNWSSADPYE